MEAVTAAFLCCPFSFTHLFYQETNIPKIPFRNNDKGGARMRMIQSEINRTELTKETIATPIQKKPTEQLSKWDIEELMGVRRDTFKKKNGAFRQR